MSDSVDLSVWSNDEMELLDNIEKEIKLGNICSDSDSSKMYKSSKESWKVLQKNDVERNVDEESVSQSWKNTYSEEFLNQQGSTSLSKLKFHFSSDDLSNFNSEDVFENGSAPQLGAASFTHSNSYNCLSSNDKTSSKKYDHVQSKVKEYFNVKNPVGDALRKEAKVISKATKEWETGKGEHLEEINQRLMREISEKNALITKLQENYENLLFKYAEAQNKIDYLRFNSVCTSTKCPVHSSALLKMTKPIRPPAKFSNDKDDQDSSEEESCVKNLLPPPPKYDFQSDLETTKTDRPSAMPKEQEVAEGGALKVGSPTDSEDVSSVITSMSGHSKILNSLSRNVKNFNLAKYSESCFLLGDNSMLDDAFSKVKNWQNSLPPLECIERPETTLYDEPLAQTSFFNYPKENYATRAEVEEEEVFPSGPNVKSEPLRKENEKDSPRYGLNDRELVSSPPGAVSKKNVSHHKQQKKYNENEQNLQDEPSVITSRRNKPQLLRCSSLPNYDTPKSSKRNIYIPPLDLENLTMSDVESSHVDYYDSDRRNLGTSSSYLTSQSGSMELPTQTYRSNYKLRTDEYSDSSFSGRPFNKSTSISPERCSEVFTTFLTSNNFCRICGEKLEFRNLPCRSTSYQNFFEVQDEAAETKTTEKRGKYPFSRSVSFNSETSSFRRCFHSQDCLLRSKKEDSLEKLDKYTNNLRARSQAVMKALAAHVNNT